MNEIICLVGFSSAGKDLAKEIIMEEYGAEEIISHTTRPIRPQETDGVDYYFVSKDEFRRKIEDGEMIEYRAYHTLLKNIPAVWFYGIAEESVQKDRDLSVVVLDMKGLRALKDRFGNRVTSIFIQTEEAVRRHLAQNRGGYDETEFNRRLADDMALFTPEVIENEVDFILHNRGESVGELALELLTVTEEILDGSK